MRIFALAVIALGGAAMSDAQQPAPAGINPELWADANAGDAEAQNSLGITYQRGLSGVAKNKAEAVKWLSKAATGGFKGAEGNLCSLYHNAIGVASREDPLKPVTGAAKEDVDGAVKWCLASAEHQFVSAQRTLGSLYARGASDTKGGTLLKVDIEKAYRWLWLGRISTKDPALVAVAAKLPADRRAAIEKEAMEWHRKAGFNGLPDAPKP